MYEVKKYTHSPDNFFAGDFPVKTDTGIIKNDAVIRKHALVIQGENGIEELTEATVDKLIGIVASDPVGDEVVYYLTGEFFYEALILPDGITVENIKPVLRKLSIFLR